MDPAQLIKRLEACLELNNAYQETYRLTKEHLTASTHGRQFELDERASS